MKIVRLIPTDIDRVTEMFIQCSAHFPYYAELAKTYGLPTLDYINTVLKEQFLETIKMGMSFGYIENDVLVGYLLMFNIQDIQLYNNDVYVEMFKGASTLKSLLESYIGSTYFIECMDMVENRSQRYLTKLLRTAVDEVGLNYNYVTDIIANTELKGALDSVGFKSVKKNGYDLHEKLYSRSW